MVMEKMMEGTIAQELELLYKLLEENTRRIVALELRIKTLEEFVVFGYSREDWGNVAGWADSIGEAVRRLEA